MTSPSASHGHPHRSERRRPKAELIYIKGTKKAMKCRTSSLSSLSAAAAPPVASSSSSLTAQDSSSAASLITPNWLVILGNLFLLGLVLLADTACVWSISSATTTVVHRLQQQQQQQQQHRFKNITSSTTQDLLVHDDDDEHRLTLWGQYRTTSTEQTVFTSYKTLCAVGNATTTTASTRAQQLEWVCDRIRFTQTVVRLSLVWMFALCMFCTFMLLYISFQYSAGKYRATEKLQKQVQWTGAVSALAVGSLMLLAWAGWIEMHGALDRASYTALFGGRQDYDRRAQYGSGLYLCIVASLVGFVGTGVYLYGPPLLKVPRQHRQCQRQQQTDVVLVIDSPTSS